MWVFVKPGVSFLSKREERSSFSVNHLKGNTTRDDSLRGEVRKRIGGRAVYVSDFPVRAAVRVKQLLGGLHVFPTLRFGVAHECVRSCVVSVYSAKKSERKERLDPKTEPPNPRR
jgi:hypothetical protein